MEYTTDGTLHPTKINARGINYNYGRQTDGERAAQHDHVCTLIKATEVQGGENATSELIRDKNGLSPISNDDFHDICMQRLETGLWAPKDTIEPRDGVDPNGECGACGKNPVPAFDQGRCVSATTQLTGTLQTRRACEGYEGTFTQEPEICCQAPGIWHPLPAPTNTHPRPLPPLAGAASPPPPTGPAPTPPLPGYGDNGRLCDAIVEDRRFSTDFGRSKLDSTANCPATACFNNLVDVQHLTSREVLKYDKGNTQCKTAYMPTLIDAASQDHNQFQWFASANSCLAGGGCPCSKNCLSLYEKINDAPTLIQQLQGTDWDNPWEASIASGTAAAGGGK